MNYFFAMKKSSIIRFLYIFAKIIKEKHLQNLTFFFFFSDLFASERFRDVIGILYLVK